MKEMNIRSLSAYKRVVGAKVGCRFYGMFCYFLLTNLSPSPFLFFFLSWWHAAACGFRSPDSLPLASTVCSNTTTHLGHNSLTFTSSASKLHRKAVPLAKYIHTNGNFQNPPGAEFIFTREHHNPDSLCMQRVNTP